MWYSLAEDCSAELKIRRSTFICSLGHVETMEDAKEFITNVSKLHKNATHNCWAYIVGDRGETRHASDAGEPAGTAGQPMLNTLAGYGLTNVACVVTRYFGGVKLGIRGLIDAYGAAARAAVEEGKLKKFVRTHSYTVKVGYAFNDAFLRHISDMNGSVTASDYTDTVTHTVAIEEGNTEAADLLFRELESAGKIEWSQPQNDNGMEQ
ncbi:MAG: YigZ family protein [Desulfarculaceae bacterium]|nr:YigZ family protein [Desulfarculaceae bacterium]